jgi:predicted nucleic acid-binding protein
MCSSVCDEALIVAAAADAGCSTLFSEDFSTACASARR